MDDFHKEFQQTSQQSKLQQDNIRRANAPYEAVMEPYYHPSREKWSFYKDDPNQGYKIHLNCDPVDAGAVSRFLKAQDLDHKYLSGGDVDSGKIFTIYTGSKEQTEGIVKILADNLKGVLKPPPKPTEEVPYAPNIFGRFVGNINDFTTKIPVRGITILRYLVSLTKPYVTDEVFQKTDQALRELYGDYYGGGITYYDPSSAVVK